MMRAIFIGPPSHAVSSRELVYWVAAADYTPGGQPVDNVPDGPNTRGLGEYPLADARDVANEEAGRLGLSVVDLTRIPQTT
jgi:hypothetical protein